MTVVICLACKHVSADFREHREHLMDADHDDKGEAFKREREALTAF
jgi:hypothetical protein